ncbi:hypothetical protein [Streptomyces sp. SLBN-118]|uniref:hypothetical protein n=1 Tax=Streptomyces sp. SLBN-118 TaxID=2768454 RepID=UPI0011503EBC|nr:hypothetical protein [Streptomyces sp. SLBN-118]
MIYLTAALVLTQGVFMIVWAVGRHHRDPHVYPGSEKHRAALASVDDGTAFNLQYWRGMSTAAQAEFGEQRFAPYEATRPNGRPSLPS